MLLPGDAPSARTITLRYCAKAMIAHLSIGVRDVTRSKSFYDAALEPLGYQCIRAAKSLVGYGYGADSISFWVFSAERPVPADEKSGLHFCFRRRMPPPSMRFTRPRCARAGKTTVHPDYGRYTAPITMPPLLSIRTATGSRLITAPAKGEGCTMCGRVGLLRDRAHLLDPAVSPALR